MNNSPPEQLPLNNSPLKGGVKKITHPGNLITEIRYQQQTAKNCEESKLAVDHQFSTTLFWTLHGNVDLEERIKKQTNKNFFERYSCSGSHFPPSPATQKLRYDVSALPQALVSGPKRRI